MKHTKVVTIPEHTKTVFSHNTCDLCGKEIDEGQGYEVDEVWIQHRHGSNYPEGDFTELDIVDMCSGCFKGLFVPWLASLGAKPRTESSDD